MNASQHQMPNQGCSIVLIEQGKLPYGPQGESNLITTKEGIVITTNKLSINTIKFLII